MSVFPHIAKASHDSGSAVRVDNPAQFPNVAGRMQKALSKPYGHGKGEWAYRFIEPRRVMVEECLPGPIVDYKFHCSDGEIRWVQVISERHHKNGPAESIFDPEGEVLPLHFDQNMRHAPNARLALDSFAWATMTEIAEILAAGWRYVRVDLYWQSEKPYFGELTFWPLAGCYKTKDEPTFGEMMPINMSNPTTLHP